MEDPLEWQEYKDKVEELTRELEELKDQVEGLSGEAAEDSGLIYLGENATDQRQMVVHYAGNLGEDLSADDYGAVRDAFEVFVKAEDNDRAHLMEVRHGDMIAGTLGADGDRVYALVTIADEDKLAGMQNIGPPPYAGSAPWSYHIYSFSSCCECACTDPHADTLNFATEVSDIGSSAYGGLDWGCVTYDTGACAYVATTTPISPDSYFFGDYTMTCEYKTDRGWTITVTGEGIETLPDSVFTGAGDDTLPGMAENIDYTFDLKPCNVDIPNDEDTGGIFLSASTSIAVTSCTP
jgi:hypothetical protein